MQMHIFDRGVGAERSLRRHAGRFGRTVEHHGQRKKGEPNACKCPNCGREEPKISGMRCEHLKCPDCGAMLEEA